MKPRTAGLLIALSIGLALAGAGITSPQRVAAVEPNKVFTHTVSNYTVTFAANCSSDPTFASSGISAKDPDVLAIQTGDVVDITFTLSPPLVVHPIADGLSIAVRLDPTDSEIFGGDVFSPPTMSLTGVNVKSFVSTTGRAGEFDATHPVVTVSASGAYSDILTDPGLDGSISSVRVSYTVPGSLPTYGDLAGTLEASLQIVSNDFDVDCSGSDPVPSLEPAASCPLGYYSIDGFAPCTPAPAGRYVDTVGATVTLACNKGSYQPDAGQASCLLAPAGTYVDITGATSTTPCPSALTPGATECIPDADLDGVPDSADQCPNTPLSTAVDANGCPLVPPDSDNDGVIDSLDLCPGTATGQRVSGRGCSIEELTPPQCLSLGRLNLIEGGPGNDVLKGTSGNDLIVGHDGNDKIDGGNGNDCIVGGDGNDSLSGGNGKDVILGGSGNDSIDGGNDDDVLLGGADADVIDGGNGNDVIRGDAGNDTLSGGNGDDNVQGGDGDDNVQGSTGNDTLYGNAGADTVNGGGGIDRCSQNNGGSQNPGTSSCETAAPVLGP